jgi:hypothetical protein
MSGWPSSFVIKVKSVLGSEGAKNAVVLVTTTLLCLLLGEVGYRAYLYNRMPDRFWQHAVWQRPEIEFVSPAHSTFNAQYGFDYPPEQTVLFGAVQAGRIVDCTARRTSALGTWNAVEGSWDDAAIKVLAVGDSFTAISHDGVSWTNVLQRLLAEHTGKTVHIRNFGRDGQGILQMLDIAAGELPKLRPNLLVIAYISNDLIRDRVWRRLEHFGGKSRLFTTASDGREFDPQQSVDTTVLIPEPLGVGWCRTPDLHGPIIREIEERHLLAILHANVRADLFTMRRAFAADKLVYGDPFRYRTGRLMRHPFSSFLDDRRTAANIEMLKASGVPIALFHMATRSELRRGIEFELSDTERRLLSSLELALGTPSIQTRERAPQWDDIETLGITPKDDHPSRAGMDFYGQALMNGLVRSEIINGVLGRSTLDYGRRRM